MIANPELMRNLWLEVTPHRLIGLPLMLSIAFLLVYAMSGYERGFALQAVALGLFIIITIAWGTQLAGDSVLAEVHGRTWDIQKLSAMTPWTLTWGKLLGATIFAWYGGAISIGVFLLATGATLLSMKVALICVLSAALAQGFGMSSALLAVRRRPPGRSTMSTLSLLVMLLLILLFVRDAVFNFTAVKWFALRPPLVDFTLWSAASFAMWAVVCSYRLMCLELQVRTLPWVWLVFALFMSVYLSGLALGVGTPSPSLAMLNTSFATALALTYLAAFRDPKDVLALRRMGTLWRRGSLRRLAEELPPWSVTFVLAGLLAAALAVTEPHLVPAPGAIERNFGPAAIAILLFATRDLALLHYFGFAVDARRAETTTLIYLGLLYWLLPALLRPLDLDLLATLLLPPLLDRPLLSATIGTVHVAAAGVLLYGRWRARMQQGAPVN
jgi:hypothetical protein